MNTSKIILIMSLSFTLSACLGGGGGGGAGASSSPPPSSTNPHETITQQAYQDREWILIPQLPSESTGCTLVNAPAFLSLSPTTCIVKGVPSAATGSFSFTLKIWTVSASISQNYVVNIAGDPLREHQWSIFNNGQSAFAHSGGISGADLKMSQTLRDGITGQGVRIAVSDSGSPLNHEDLSANLLSGEHRNYKLAFPYVGDPTPDLNVPNNEHGLAVSSIIAAIGWNNKGLRGIAPNAKVANFLLLADDAPSNSSIEVHQAGGNFDIFNYSYGKAQFLQSPMNSLIHEKIWAQLRDGRGGKGALYVKSAGNDFDDCYDYVDLESCNQFTPANRQFYFLGNSSLDEINNHPGIIVVGALGAHDVRSSYSSPGSNLWISAPGGEYGGAQSGGKPAIIAADFSGCSQGASRTANTANSFESGSHSLNSQCNYTSTMNGTSSAAPNTSGAIALLLEAYPHLTWREIKDILAKSARRVHSGSTSVTHPGGLNLTGHTYMQGWRQNQAGFWFHNWYGFGAVDVDAAMAVAKTYSSTLTNLRSTADLTANWGESSGTIDLGIPDNSATGASHTINLRQNLKIEAVQIRLSTVHPSASDLGIELTSPSGTRSQLLLINSNIATANLVDAIFASNAFYGEQSAGNWTIKVIDGFSGGNGQLTKWDLRVYGHIPAARPDLNPPIAVASVSHAATFNSSHTSPVVTWPATASSDLLRYEVSVGTSPGATNTSPWRSAGALTSFSITDLNLSAGQTYYVNVRVVDQWENVSSVTTSSGWLYTTEAAPTISIGHPLLALGNSSASFDYPIGISGAANLTLSIGQISLTTTGSATCANKSVSGAGLTSRTVSLSGCSGNGTVRISIAAGAATSSMGVASAAAGPSNSITIDNTAPTISGLSDNSTPVRSKTWSWSCSEVCTYQVVVDTSPSTSPSTSFLAGSSVSQTTGTGTYYVHVRARDSAGNLSTVSHAFAVLDNTAPALTGLSADSTWRTSKTWNWSCSEACSYRFSVSTSSTWSPTGTFSAVASTSQTSGTGTYYLHVQAEDVAGNTSEVTTVSALLDNTAPTSPSGLSLSAAFLSSLTQTPTIVFTNGSDSGQSGIAQHQVRIQRVSDNAVVQDWTSHTSGALISGLSLASNMSYRIQVSALDHVGLRSPIISATWIADTTSPTPPSNLTLSAYSNGLSESPILTFSVSSDSGSGLAGYSARIVRASDSQQVLGFMSITSGNRLTGLSLDDSTNYTIELRAADLAGNTSTVVTQNWSTNLILFNELASTDESFCGITTAGSVKCWGQVPHYGVKSTPFAIPNLTSGVSAIAGSPYNYCVIQSGNVLCFGPFLDGSNATSHPPTAIAGLQSGTATEISLSNTTYCAIDAGTVKCWGNNSNGQIGDGTQTHRTSPVSVTSVAGTATQISLSSQGSTCMMINDLRYCWGNNDNSKHYLGLEYSSGVYLLSPSTLWRRADALTRMKNGFYGIKADGTLHCWGQAHPCDTPSSTPYTPAGMTNISDIAGYGTKPPSSGVNGGVCFIQSGSVRCLGNNSYGAMGRVPISTSDFSNFVNVSGSGGTYLKIAGRYPSFCAIRSDQSVQCWGRNNKGQLGDKTTVDSATVVNLNGN